MTTVAAAPTALRPLAVPRPASAPAVDDESASWLNGVADATVALMEAIGPVGAGLAIALESVFPPLPSEAVLPMAGLTASRGGFTLAEALAWTTVGSLVGALVLYALGVGLGLERLRRIAARMPLVDVTDVDRTVAWFERHGGKAVFFGRMLPIFRSLVSIPAGVTRMRLWRFIVLTAAGSLIWNTVFVMAGYLLGESWHVVEQYADVVKYAVILAVVLGAAWFVVRRVRDRRIRRRLAALRRDVRSMRSVAGRSADPENPAT